MSDTQNPQPVEVQEDAGRSRVLAGVGKAGMIAASVALPIVAIIGALLAMYVLFTSIQHLGTTALVVNSATATIVAASVTVTLGLLLITDAALALTGKRRTLLVAGLFTLAWLALAVLMAILDTAITVAQIKVDQTLLVIGTFIYSALPALPVIPMIALAASAAHEKHDQYPTLASAGGSMLLSVLKVLLTVAMFAFEAFFGISLGLNPMAAIFAATLNATAFALALGNTDAARHENDRQGVNTWGAISTFYALLMFVIAIEAIIKLSAGAQQSGTLAAMHAPAWLETLALWAFVSSIGLSALLLALTFWRKSARGLASTDSRPSMGERIRIVRAQADDVRDALRGPQRPALPAGTTFASAVTGAALEDDEAMRKVAVGVGRPDPEVEASQADGRRRIVPAEWLADRLTDAEITAALADGTTDAEMRAALQQETAFRVDWRNKGNGESVTADGRGWSEGDGGPKAAKGRPKRSESGVGYDTTAEVVLTPADDASLRNAGKNGQTKTAPMDEAAAAVRAEAAARKARRAGGGAPPEAKS
jgi:hypothetical protein